MHLNWADYVIIAIIVLSVGISFVRGFIREILSILGWIVVFWVSIAYYDKVANLFTPIITNQNARQIISFILLFVSMLAVVLLVNYFVSKTILRSGFDTTDRILGVFFGFIRGILLVSVLLLLAKLTYVTQSQWWNDSAIIPKFEPIVEWFQSLLPEGIDQAMDNEVSTESLNQATEFSIS